MHVYQTVGKKISIAFTEHTLLIWDERDCFAFPNFTNGPIHPGIQDHREIDCTVDNTFNEIKKALDEAFESKKPPG